MERQQLNQEEMDTLRNALMAANASIPGQWAPEDDPKRTGDLCPGSPIKRDDDVKTRDGIFRALCPAVGRDRFMAYGDPGWGWGYMTTSLGLHEVIDRAPVDPNETPMPVLPPPEQQ